MIDVQNLTKYYGDFCAVDGISLTIQPGEILGLLGPNGAGKTTTLRMLTGYFTPTSGSIRVNDLEMPRDTLKIKALIGYLPESAPLYHNMLVFDYLEYVAKVKGIPNGKRLERLRELSELCGLGEIMHKSVDELSKGLKQRVGLAHAMMTDPEILILDEPTRGIDVNAKKEIYYFIHSLITQGVSCILISSELEDSQYWELNGRRINKRKDGEYPNPEYLRQKCGASIEV